MKHNAGFLALVEQARREINECTVQDVKAWQDAARDFILIDVREESEWTKSRIPQAVYLGRGVLERDIETHYPKRDTAIVLYCGGGYRSALSAENLQKMGYTQVINMDGGIRGWQQAGFALDETAI